MSDRVSQIEKQPRWHIVHKGSRLKSRDRKDILEKELEQALEQKYDVIVVEPRFLGDEVIRWITFGNFLHKSAVLANLGTLILLPTLSGHIHLYITVPLGAFGICSAVLYNISWQFDPCSKYQVDRQGNALSNIPSEQLTASSPVVLVRRNDIYRKILHSTLALVVCAYFSWKWYSSRK